MKNLRKAERYDDFGRVECREMCLISGVLLDISKSGLGVSFSIPPVIDLEKEYEVSVRLSRVTDESLLLTVKPVRVYESDSKTIAGFSILHSKDTARLDSYLKLLKEDLKSENDRLVPQTDDDSLFI